MEDLKLLLQMQALMIMIHTIKAAIFLGREAGMAPQVPLTFKNISIDGERHVLNDVEKSKALNGGV